MTLSIVDDLRLHCAVAQRSYTLPSDLSATSLAGWFDAAHTDLLDREPALASRCVAHAALLWELATVGCADLAAAMRCQERASELRAAASATYGAVECLVRDLEACDFACEVASLALTGAQRAAARAIRDERRYAATVFPFRDAAAQASGVSRRVDVAPVAAA